MKRLALRHLAAAALVSLGGLVFLPAGRAVSPTPSALDTQTTDERLTQALSSNLVKDRRIGIGTVDEFLSYAFGIPTNWEWPYVDSTGRPLPSIDLVPNISPGDSLRAAIQEILRISDGRLVMDAIRGNLCIRAPENTAEKTVNVLDRAVSFSVEGVSTWHAMMALVEAINALDEDVPETYIFPAFETHLRKGPPGFREGSEITLTFEDVIAREALCRIFEASPFEMNYRYWNYYRPDRSPNSKRVARIRIMFMQNGEYYSFHERMPEDEIILYMDDFAKMRRAEEK